VENKKIILLKLLGGRRVLIFTFSKVASGNSLHFVNYRLLSWQDFCKIILHFLKKYDTFSVDKQVDCKEAGNSFISKFMRDYVLEARGNATVSYSVVFFIVGSDKLRDVNQKIEELDLFLKLVNSLKRSDSSKSMQIYIISTSHAFYLKVILEFEKCEELLKFLLSLLAQNNFKIVLIKRAGVARILYQLCREGRLPRKLEFLPKTDIEAVTSFVKVISRYIPK